MVCYEVQHLTVNFSSKSERGGSNRSQFVGWRWDETFVQLVTEPDGVDPASHSDRHIDAVVSTDCFVPFSSHFLHQITRNIVGKVFAPVEVDLPRASGYHDRPNLTSNGQIICGSRVDLVAPEDC